MIVLVKLVKVDIGYTINYNISIPITTMLWGL